MKARCVVTRKGVHDDSRFGVGHFLQETLCSWEKTKAALVFVRERGMHWLLSPGRILVLNASRAQAVLHDSCSRLGGTATWALAALRLDSERDDESICCGVW